MPKLSVGIIVDDADQTFFTYDLYRRSLDSELYSIEALIVQKPGCAKERSKLQVVLHYFRKRGLKRLIDRIAFAILEKFEMLVAGRDPVYRKVLDNHSLDAFVGIPRIFVNPNVSPSGFVYRYTDADIESIKRLDLDMLIRGGSGILRGKILDVCAFGVISFHHADNHVNRGGPPGFWEVFHREASTGFVIQRLLPELDGGDVIFKGSIPTSFWYQSNVCKLYMKSSFFLHFVIERIARQRNIGQVYEKLPYAFRLYTVPTAAQTASYIFRTLAYVAKKGAGKIVGMRFRWGVAYQFVHDWQSAVLWRSKTIKNPPGRFLADPFVVSFDEMSVVFVEDYDYRAARGKIAAYEINGNGYRELGVALEESFHLSYPFIFQVDDELYMCPETHEARDIRIYKCLKFPLDWELHRVLLADTPAVDTNIFRFGDRYWMMANIDSADIGEYDSELHVYYADSFDSQDWRPHPLNPVVFDSRHARNGGLLFHENDVYRVFQVQEFGMYGAMMGVAKIVELTCDTYVEEIVSLIPPKFFRNIKGTHTFSFDDGALAVDFVKYEFYKR